MTDDPERWIPEEAAARLWKRAAELQAEAAQRLEERSRSLAPRDDAPRGYRLEHVREAAREAGIAPEFVELAMAEMEERASMEAREGGADRLSRRFLGPVPSALILSRVFHATPERVFETLRRVLPAAPFCLTLSDSRGPHPLQGGVMVFDVPPLVSADESHRFAYEMTWGDVKELHVRLQPLGTDPPRCEMAIRAPLGHSRRLNLWVGGGVTGFLGAVGGGMGVVVGAVAAGSLALAPPLGVAAALAGGLLGGGSVAGASTWGWRGLYRYALRRSERALGKLLQAVNAQLNLGDAFAPPAATPPPLKGTRTEE